VLVTIISSGAAMTGRYTEKHLKKGSHIYIEGDENSENLFLLKTGKVRLECSCRTFSSDMRSVSTGDFFGFISAFSLRPRLCTAIADEDCLFVELTRDNFFKYFIDNPDLTMKILGSFSMMLQNYDKLLLNIKPINLIYPDSLNLFNLGLFYMKQGKKVIPEYIFSRYVELFPDDELADKSYNFLNEISSAQVSSGYEPVEDKNNIYYPDGSVIFCEYEPGDMLYYIKQGKVKIVKQNREREIMLAVLGEDEIFGELALLTRFPRSATAISSGGVKLMPVDRNNLKLLIKTSPDLVKKIFISISQRLWFNHLRLDLMSYRKPVTRLYAFLENKLLEEHFSLKSKMKHTFQFGIDELLEMNEVPYSSNHEIIDELTDNPYLNFHFGNITITNIKEFAATVKTHKQRDHISLPMRRQHGPESALTETSGIDSAENTVAIEKELMSLIPNLHSEDPMTRVQAVIELGSLGHRARNAADDLKLLLGDRIKNIRRNAARSLINILETGESIALFREELNSSESSVRSSALSGLSEINAINKSEIIGLLIKSIMDESSEVRSTAARLLGGLGKDSAQAIPYLLKSLNDREKSVRLLSVSSLEQLWVYHDLPGEITERISDVSKKDGDKFVRNAAKKALIKLNRKRKLISGRSL